MFAGLFEEICQIHFVSSVGVSRKTDGTDEDLVVAVGIKESAMHAAKVDKVQSGSSHDEHGLKIVAVGGSGKVQNSTAVGAHGKLTNAVQLTVHQGLIGQQLGVKGDIATGAEQLLLAFFLNG